MPNSIHWRQEIIGSTSEYNNATNYIFKKSSSKCSFFYVGTVFTNMPSCFSEWNFCGSYPKTKLTFPSGKKDFPLNVPPNTYNAILTTLPRNWTKTQKPSAHFLKIIIQTNNSLKKHISWENVSSHIDCLPGSLAERISPEIWRTSCSKKIGRKLVHWDNFFLKRFPWTRRKQKRHSC